MIFPRNIHFNLLFALPSTYNTTLPLLNLLLSCFHKPVARNTKFVLEVIQSNNLSCKMNYSPLNGWHFSLSPTYWVRMPWGKTVALSSACSSIHSSTRLVLTSHSTRNDNENDCYYRVVATEISFKLVSSFVM